MGPDSCSLGRHLSRCNTPRIRTEADLPGPPLMHSQQLHQLLEDIVLKTFSHDITSNTSSRRGHSKMPVSNSHFALSSTSLGGMEPMKRVTKLLCCIFAMLVLTSLSVCYGQDVSGMTGEVTDSSGAAIPGARSPSGTVPLERNSPRRRTPSVITVSPRFLPARDMRRPSPPPGLLCRHCQQHLLDRCHNPHAECNVDGGPASPGG